MEPALLALTLVTQLNLTSIPGLKTYVDIEKFNQNESKTEILLGEKSEVEYEHFTHETRSKRKGFPKEAL